MKIKFTKTSNTQQEVEIEVFSEDFSGYLDKAARKLSENLDVQGFRSGHVPRSIVEQRVGSDKLYREAAELAIKASYLKALNEKVASADTAVDGNVLKELIESMPKQLASEVHVLKLVPGNPFIYKIIFKVPYFALANSYKDIAKKVLKEEGREISVEESEVEDTLNWLRKNYKKGFSGAPSADKEKEKLPELNDDFAKSIGDFGSMDDLRKSVSEGIRMEKEKKEKDRVRISILRGIAAKSKYEIPKEVLDMETRKAEEEFKESISHMGLELDEYLSKIQKKKEDLEEGWREKAGEQLEVSLILDAVSKEQNIEPQEEAVKKEVQKLLSRFKDANEAEGKISPDRLREYVYNMLKNEKTLEFLEKL